MQWEFFNGRKQVLPEFLDSKPKIRNHFIVLHRYPRRKGQKMARGEMLTVFSYDIARDRIRRKAAKFLGEAASRVQLSVFETRLPRHTCEALAQRVAALLEPGDSLRVYVVGADGESRSRVYGDALPFEPEAAYWIA